MKIVLAKRALQRIESSRLFLENEFYPEYGRNFEDKVLETIRMLHDQPDLGHEAFPELNRPDLRKLLCKCYSYWIFYRRKKNQCEILSVRHTLMNINTPRQL
ncbi:MAG: type II toxin-antitoxin system RelE/ParE family toxin [Kiritimatiellae bacterium]|nr:type II toxin-antitoxin system RelE/ParE family toxin [Kiritimatiellia bacterium]